MMSAVSHEGTDFFVEKAAVSGCFSNGTGSDLVGISVQEVRCKRR
jgi:hypothetical protein